MGSIYGIVILNDRATAETLNHYWSAWQFLQSDEKYRRQKRRSGKSLQIKPHILPFDYGYFERNDSIPIREISKEEIENILFIITPEYGFLYYYDYEAADMSDYYKYQIYLKPSFSEIIEQTIEKYKDCFVTFARCRW